MKPSAAGAASAAESIYEGSVTVITEDGTATIEDVYNAVADAKGFTYTVSQWGTIADINGIANTETEFWMTSYENNGGTPVYSVADPVIEGAVITLEYQTFDENWKPIDTKYTAKNKKCWLGFYFCIGKRGRSETFRTD